MTAPGNYILRVIAFFLLFSSFVFGEIKAVVFDYGGVIGVIDKEKVIQYVAHQLQVNDQEARAIIRWWKQEVIRGGEEEEVFWNQVSLKYGKPLSRDWIASFEATLNDALSQNSQIVSLIEQLHAFGYQTPLFSNISTKNAADILRRKGYYDLFYPLILSYEIGFAKPDPRAYECLINILSIHPDEILLIDNIKENVEGAKLFGMHAIQFVSPEQLYADLCLLVPKIFVDQKE